MNKIGVLMYLKNIAGYNIRVLYRGGYVTIMSDGNIYRMPDDFEVDKYTGIFQIIHPSHVRTKPVIYIKVNGEVSEHIKSFRKKQKESLPLYNAPKINIYDLMELDNIIAKEKKYPVRKSVTTKDKRSYDYRKSKKKVDK